MAEFLIAFGLILLALGGLAVGVFFGRAPLKGSCGGLSCIHGAQCAACPKTEKPE